MKKKYFTLLFMLSCFVLLAQSNVSINVTDAVTTNPIEDADVTLNSTTLMTDVNGNVTFTNISDGVYPYTITKTCYAVISGSITVSGANVTENVTMNSQTSAAVFIATSSNPIIGAWVDGDVELTDGTNTYTKSVTEFDNIISGVEFGTYTFTFTRPGACDVTGTVDVNCGTIEAASGNVFLPIVSEDQTTAPVFVSTSSNPIIGAWVDGDVELTDGTNTYTKSVTEFDNIIPGVEFGTYTYTFTRPGACDVTGTVDVNCGTIEAASGNVFLPITSEDQTSAAVFIATSSNPIIGAWVDGDVELTDGTNTYTKSVTEFDNIISGVEFGTYTYTFTRPGACDVTGTVDVNCGTIEAASGNVFLPITSEDQTSAAVFIATSSNPIIGAWVDGDVELTDGTNTYTKSVTEFDNIISGVEFGTYTYTFTRPGACDVTGTVDVNCGTIEAASGNVFLPITSEDQTSAAVFIATSSNPIIGAWVDGDVELTDGTNTYTKSVTEFDNIISGVEFGTYTYTFTRPGACDVTGTVDVNCGTIEAASGNVFLPITSEDQTSAAVFIATSSNPIIGAWVDGDVELTDGTNTYTKSVTEFDNIIPGVEFGTYNFTFTRPGACDITGTVDVNCGTIEAASGNVFLPIVSEDQTTAPVFVSTSSNPIIGAWVDGDVELTDGTNTYTKSVTEFDNIIPGVEFGTYTFTFTRPGACDITGTVDVNCGTIEAASGNVFLPIVSEDQTTAPVFVSTSSNPIIGAWVDGDVELTDGTNTYTKSVTEFDNIISGVEFGTYTYTFSRPGACDVTGTVDVNCGTIEAASGNVFLPIVSEDQTTAPVFVSTSSNPIIGAWVDGDVELTDGTNTYTKSVTEFDNIISGVEFGTYTYTFSRPGACDVTGTVDVNCGTIEAASGNVFLPIVSEDQTTAPVFVSTSSNPIIGAWVDGDVELTDGTNTYTKSVTEFDNIISGVEFGTYTYTFTRPGACDVTGTVDVNCGTIEAASGNVFLPITSEDQTSAAVFIATSSNPIIGAWVDGDVELTDGTNTYTKSVTEFDNIISGVEFGTYTFTFTRPGACDVTGTVDVNCGTIEAASGNVFLPITSEDQTSAAVFIATSSNPIIGAWVDGDVELTDGTNTYTKSVTEFDNIIPGVEFGTYTYTFTRPGACDVTGTVDVNCGTIEAASGNVFLPITSEDQTSAAVFIATSSNPIIGAWVDGDVELTDGTNTYTKSVTEFDNIISGVEFGTYTYTFTRPGACDVTGTVDVNCGTIEAASGNVFLPITSEDQTSAAVFIATSSNPIIGAWVDGDVELTDGTNTYTKSVTEFDNIIPGVEFGTYNFTFTRPGACDITGTVDVNCGTIEAASGNVFLPIVSEDQTTAPVFVSTSSNPIIGAWVDGDVELTDGTNTYTKSVTEFDNIIPGVEFGTYNFTFTRPGACDITGTVDVNCGTIEAASGNVFLPIVSEDASVDTSVTQNNEILTANISGANITYQWIDCNNGNAPISGETNQTFTASANGNYAVIVTDTDCGLSETSACIEVNSLSVSTFENQLNISLYPNPVVDSVHITLGKTYENLIIQVYSLTGQLVKTVNGTNSLEFDMDMSNLPSGHYLLKINAEGSNKSSMIIKK